MHQKSIEFLLLIINFFSQNHPYDRNQLEFFFQTGFQEIIEKEKYGHGEYAMTVKRYLPINQTKKSMILREVELRENDHGQLIYLHLNNDAIIVDINHFRDMIINDYGYDIYQNYPYSYFEKESKIGGYNLINQISFGFIKNTHNIHIVNLSFDTENLHN